MAASAVFSMSLAYCSTYNLTPAIAPVLIGRHLSFARPRDHCAVTSVKNVRQLNARRRKKLGSDCHIDNLLVLGSYLKNIR